MHARAMPPLDHLLPGVPWSIKHLARLPNDDVLRPSTLLGTECGINVRHEIVLEVGYRVVPQQGIASPADDDDSDNDMTGDHGRKDKEKEREREKKRDKQRMDEVKTFSTTRSLQLSSVGLAKPPLISRHPS